MIEKASRESGHSRAEPVDDQPPHELEFTANAAAWLTSIFDKDPASPFASASCEKRSRGRQLRRDLTLHGKNGRALITGEVKLPYQKDGATPYHADVVKDARQGGKRQQDTNARRSARTANELAAEIVAELRDKHDRLLLPFDDFVDHYGHYDSYEVPVHGIAERHQDMFAGAGTVRFMKGRRQHGLVQVRHVAQAELLVDIANRGVRGLVRLPLEPADSERLRHDWLRHLHQRDERFAALAAERTSDADFQHEIVEAAIELAIQHG